MIASALAIWIASSFGAGALIAITCRHDIHLPYTPFADLQHAHQQRSEGERGFSQSNHNEAN